MNAVVKTEPPQQQKPLPPLEKIKRAMYPQIKALCPNDEKMANSLFATAVRLASDPKIMTCTQASIVNCFTRAIDLGLQLDPSFGEVNFIPYTDWQENSVTELTIQLGAKGYAALAQRLGGWQIQIVPVFDCDIYEVRNTFKNNWMESETVLEFNQSERNLHIHDQAWCHEHLKAVIATARRKENGDWVVISLEPAMTRNEIERRRLISSNQKAGKFTKADKKARLDKGLPIGVWQDHYLAMAEKTALAAIARKLPKNKGTERLLAVIDNSDSINSTAKVVENEPATTTVYQLPEIPNNTVNADLSNLAMDVQFSELPPDNVDMETGEILSSELPQNETLILFTGEKYILGSLGSCQTPETLHNFWESVPDEFKTGKYLEKFQEKQDLMR